MRRAATKLLNSANRSDNGHHHDPVEEEEEVTIDFLRGNDDDDDKPRDRAGTEDSVDSINSFNSFNSLKSVNSFTSVSSRQSLADALKHSGDFHFDMSDRWRTALMESLDHPIFPEPPDDCSNSRILPRHRQLRKGVTNFVKRRTQGIRRGDSRRAAAVANHYHHPAPPLATS